MDSAHSGDVFCFANWEPSLGISTWWDPETYLKPEDLVESNPMGGRLHPFKDRHAPGHSIVPTKGTVLDGI